MIKGSDCRTIFASEARNLHYGTEYGVVTLRQQSARFHVSPTLAANGLHLRRNSEAPHHLRSSAQGEFDSHPMGIFSLSRTLNAPVSVGAEVE